MAGNKVYRTLNVQKWKVELWSWKTSLFLCGYWFPSEATICWVNLLSASCALLSKLMSVIMSSITAFAKSAMAGESCQCISGVWFQWIEDSDYCSPPSMRSESAGTPPWRASSPFSTTLSRGELARGFAMVRMERNTKINVKASVTWKCMFVL